MGNGVVTESKCDKMYVHSQVTSYGVYVLELDEGMVVVWQYCVLGSHPGFSSPARARTRTCPANGPTQDHF